MWTREQEAALVDSMVQAVESQRSPVSSDEADVYRLAGQLLKTRYRQAAAFLDGAARAFYSAEKVVPRSYPQVVADGLVSDVARLRNLLEKRMSGVTSW